MKTYKELIDNYFEKTLTKSEIKTFDQLKINNNDFREEFEFQQKIKAGLENNARQEIKKILINIEETIINERSTPVAKLKPYRIKWQYLTAACMIIVLGISYIFNQEETTYNFQMFYETYPNVVEPITRSEEDDHAKIEKTAFIAYENKNFKEADSLFNTLIDQHKEYILFYKGITKIELREYDSAQIYFENYLYSDGMQFRDQAKWYMALSYLVAGDTVNGKKYLERLKQNSGYKMEEVEKILNEIKSK
jgi:hypothetical protein